MLNLDLSKEMTGGHIVHGRVGDNNSHIEKVSVINSDGTPFNLTGIAISFMGNTHEYQTKVIDSDGVKIVDATKGLFQYTFPSMAFGVAGPYERAYFQFTNKDGVITSTGDFEVIVLDNTDITSNEAETIITEYNKLVAELNKLQKEEIAELTRLQNEAIDEMDQNFAVAQERIVELEGQISDLRSQIEQALADFETGNFWTKEESFNKEQSSANVVNQLSGADSARVKKDFLVNGIEGTGGRDDNGATVPFSQKDYEDLLSDDGVVRAETLIPGRGAEEVAVFNVIEILENRYPDLFQGFKTMAEKIVFYKTIVKSFATPFVARGGGVHPTTGSPSKYSNIYLKTSSGGWTGVSSGSTTNNTDSFREFSGDTWSTASANDLQADGTYEFRICSRNNQAKNGNAQSDGVTPAWVEVKKLKLVVELELNGREIILSTIAAYCGEKESGTWIQKEQSLGADEDMNDFNEIGTYTVSYNHRINQPANIGSQQGWLTVYQASPTSSVVSQEVIYPNAGASKGGARMFARNLLNKNTNLWGDWQEITKLFASQLEVINGTSDDKMISPKTLADTIKFKEVFKEGIALSNVANEGTLVPHGDSVGGSLNHVNNRPYTVNSDGSFTFKRATNLLVTGGMKLVVGDTNPTDYLHVNAYVNNALNEFIALGATAATNGTLRLTWSAMGQRVISVNSGDVLSLKIGLRSGKQAFAVQLTSLKIEEV